MPVDFQRGDGRPPANERRGDLRDRFRFRRVVAQRFGEQRANVVALFVTLFALAALLRDVVVAAARRDLGLRSGGLIVTSTAHPKGEEAAEARGRSRLAGSP